VEEVDVFLVDLSSAFLVEVVLALAVVVALTVGVAATDVVELGIPLDVAEGVELEAAALDAALLTLALALAEVARVVPETTLEEVAELEPPDEAVFQYSSRRDSTPLTLRYASRPLKKPTFSWMAAAEKSPLRPVKSPLANAFAR
jgi:hypothetical protein